MDETRQQWRDVIRAARKGRNWTQQQLADYLCVSRNTVARWEMRNPKHQREITPDHYRLVRGLADGIKLPHYTPSETGDRVMITYYDTDNYIPTRRGHRVVENRTCADCRDLNNGTARATGLAADQASPCPCCQRTPEQNATRPTCHHDGIWELARDQGF